jgi:hypothetical protein
MYYVTRLQFNYYRLYPNSLDSKILELIELAKPSKLFVVLDDISEAGKYTTDVDYQLFQHVDNLFRKYNVEYCLITDKVSNKDYQFPIKSIAFSGLGLVTYYHQYYGHNRNNNNLGWNFKSNTGLYIPGKIQRLSRTLPMYELYKNNLLDKFIWSYNVNTNNKKIIREQFLNHLSQDEFENFVNQCNRSLDINTEDSRVGFESDFILSNPWPYNEKLYSDTSFSLISECWFHYPNNKEYVYVTEKTYRPILNMHPFILIGCKGTLKTLKEMGYETFTDYMLIKDYDDIESEHDRIIAAIKNVEYFQNHFTDHIEEIKQQVVHNFHNFHNMMKTEIESIDLVLPKDTDPRTSFTWKDIRHC